MRLTPCPHCNCHVLTIERACPHCGASGAPFLAALALAATMVLGCGERTDGGAGSGTASAKASAIVSMLPSAAPVYGIAVTPGALPSGPSGSAPNSEPSGSVAPSTSSSAAPAKSAPK